MQLFAYYFTQTKHQYNKNKSTSDLYASFLKGQGHQGIKTPYEEIVHLTNRAFQGHQKEAITTT